MIMQEYVEITWASNNKKYFIEKGYQYTKLGNKLVVKVSDLLSTSSTRIDAKCSHCEITKPTPYKTVLYSLTETYRKTFYCGKCRGKAIKAEFDAKQKLGLLKPGDNGYFSYTENIEKTLKEYIEENGTIDNLCANYSSLHDAVQQKDSRSLYEIVTDIGYNFKEISSMMPNGFYEDFDRVKEEIEGFIERNNRFPDVGEVINELRIHGRAIAFHGGMEGLRQKMGYENEVLIDDSGYKNRSIFEFKVAQYLIHNSIFAKRDVTIFEGERYTCDFVIETNNGEKYYIECWGYSLRDNHPLSEVYIKKKNIKVDLYKENNMNLISIDLIDTQNMSQEKFQIYLKDKFKEFIDKELVIFKNVEFLDVNNITNDEILKGVMKYSSNEEFLPTQDHLISKTGYQYVTVIKDRFGGYKQFSDFFGKKRALNKASNFNK